MKKVALISTYCDTIEKQEVLEKNIKNIKICGLDVIVISPIFLPEKIQKLCDYFLLIKDNPILVWPDKAMVLWRTLMLDSKQIKISTCVPDYGWAGLCHVKKLSEIALSYDYDYFYHMIYDLKFDETVVEGLLSERECDVYSSKRGETIWGVGLHFMIFNRENLEKFIKYIDLKKYLESGSDCIFDFLRILRNTINYNVVKTPVEDEIYLYQNIDLLNSFKIDELKIFIEKNYEKDTTIKLLFYDVTEVKKFSLKVGEGKYQYEINKNTLIDLGFKKTNIPYVFVEYNNVSYDITKTIENIKHNILEEIE